MNKFLCTILFWALSQFNLWAQNNAKTTCADLVKDYIALNDSGKFYAKKKFFISADSFFKAAQNIKNQNDSCKIYDEDIETYHVSILPATTYQKLMENVMSLQDYGNYNDAYVKYNSAGVYFAKFQVSEFNLVHDSIVNFVFEKCKNGFAVWLSNYYFNKKLYTNTLSIYKKMVESGYDAEKIKRPLYDLGEQMAIVDKLKLPNDNPKGLILQYIGDKSELKYFKMGYLFGWGRN